MSCILYVSLTSIFKLPEAEAALVKAEKMFEKFSKILSISQDDVEDWDIKLSLAMARYTLNSCQTTVNVILCTYTGDAL